MLPDVHFELELVEQRLVAEAADPGPLGLVRGPKMRLELFKLGKGVAAIGALEKLVTVVKVLEGRFLRMNQLLSKKTYSIKKMVKLRILKIEGFQMDGGTKVRPM